MIFHILKHRSIVAALVGTLILRVASAAMGSMIQLYFGYIDRSVYPLSATMRGVALAIFFLPELIFSPVFGAWSDATDASGLWAWARCWVASALRLPR